MTEEQFWGRPKQPEKEKQNEPRNRTDNRPDRSGDRSPVNYASLR